MKAWFLKEIVEAILNWLAKFLTDKVQKEKEQRESREEMEKEARRNTDKLNDAVTEKEVEDAIDDIAKGSF